MALPETLRGEIRAVRDSVPYAGTTFISERPMTEKNTNSLPKAERTQTHARRYLLKERARTVINSGTARVPDLDSISRRIIRNRFKDSHENNHRLGVAHNAVIVERLTDPGEAAHRNAMRELTQLVANDPNALSKIKDSLSKFDK